jgi:hypothetical protein
MERLDHSWRNCLFHLDSRDSPGFGRRFGSLRVRNDSNIYQNLQSSPGVWAGWTVVGSGSFTAGPAAILNSAGCMEMVTPGKYGQMYANRQVSPGGPWIGWTALGATSVFKSVPLAVLDSSLGVEMFALGSDGNIYFDVEPSPGGTWTGIVSIGGTNLASAPVRGAGVLIDMEIYALGTDGKGYSNTRSYVGGAWSGWTALGTAPGSGLTMFPVVLSGQVFSTNGTTALSGETGLDRVAIGINGYRFCR